MSTPKHTPNGRGYTSSLNYWTHKNDFWSTVSAQDGCSQPIKDLWQSNATHPHGAPAFHLMGTQYEEYLFRDEALRVLGEHPAETPFMLFYAAHVGHFPLQVPKDAFDKTVLTEGVGDVQSCGGSTGPVWPGWSNSSDGYSCRRQYHAMVNLLDEVISDLTSTMVSKAMWEKTLMIFTSDNGGQAKWQNAAGANMPLVRNSRAMRAQCLHVTRRETMRCLRLHAERRQVQSMGGRSQSRGLRLGRNHSSGYSGDQPARYYSCL